ncbi:hypothetical protein P4V88_05810 [Bacillus thuringiensis]|uniref:hypothetical protein n=1 Tax=Bacillus thuringiensis TaxID=1428 RepID=UPI000A392DF4|nr:hypothetical protein [Bacillus thuringiensis]MED2125440.1 hypothetical protein [Bacillus thuringiensis]MED2146792.1 hypothetical protein [Bacillus thuringiensis]MED2171493.1 hypothetical protein [Bacillus thuringiensis]MED2476184.1 hypothetical protein [Bacillus thuringiensis]MED2573177.1 hypothetical protein [Bacillus thuringiensis]
MKNLIKPITYLLAFVLTFTGLFVNHSFAATDKPQNTIEQQQIEFENHIKQLATTDQEAQISYEQYSQLSDEKKKDFVKALNSEEFIKALQATTTLNPGQSKTFNNGSIIASVVEEGEFQNSGPYALAGGHAIKERNVTHKVVVYGIFATIYWLKVRFQHDLGSRNVTKTISADNGHTNINPGIIVTDQNTNHWAAAGWAYGTGKFKLAATGSLGFWSFTHVLNIKTDSEYTTGWINE